MSASYRRLFAAPGALAFTLTGLLARLSFSMTGVSTVVLVATRWDSYALAGAVSAAGVAAVAVGMPLLGRLVDRYGQARVSVPCVLAAAGPMAGLLLCAHYGAPAWTLFVCQPLASVLPNLGGMARARWAHLYADDPDARHTANSLEQSLDEVCFMAGPVLGMALCTSLFPEAGLLTGAVLGGTGLLLFAAQRRTEPPVAPLAAPGTARSGVLRSRRLRLLVAVFTATGVLFGAMEVTTVAYADALGHRAAAGWLLGLVAAGSGISGLLSGLVRSRTGPATRLLAGLGVLALLVLLPLLVGRAGGGLALLGPALFAVGVAVAPTMVTGMTLVQEVLPEGRLNEGMGLAVAGILVGISAGAAVGGAVAQHASPGTGYAIPAAAALLALAVTAAGHRQLNRATGRATGGGGTHEGAEVPVAG
ncbi:MFS transporter [Kitasatospora sp. NPDC096147]|uniref:MFS transporter n=1 Tax=Kitasatospora sp. NPDC096147 TaxID=3364093 RepID=UPI003829FD46